jgi:hypothetical protein
MPVGRPTDYTEELANRILLRIVGGESVNAICRDKNTPNISTIYRWLASNKEFCELYEKAKDDQADTLADSILEISDTAMPENVQVARLRVDARKWVAAKLKPRKYGDRADHNVTFDGKLEVSWLE